MSIYSKEENKIHENHVRRAMVRLTLANENTSLKKIQETLDKAGQHLNIGYIDRLRKRIMRERGIRLDKQLVREELARSEDMFQEVNHEMYKILQDGASTNAEKVAAARTIIGNEQRLLTMKLDAGVFKKQLGVIEIDSPAARILKAILLPHERGKLPKNTETVPQLLPGSVQDSSLPISEGNSGGVPADRLASELGETQSALHPAP